jgi:preprotein translocase subunit SecE
MSVSTVETVSSAAERLRLVGSLVLAFAAIAGFYAFSKQGIWVQLAVLLGGWVAALALFLVSDMGKRFLAYCKDSVREVRKVVWPSRQEAGQMTLYVFLFVLVMALFLWVVDKTLEWALFDLILGWRR